MMKSEVWVLFGIYYEENFYECEEVISIHAEAFTAHEHKNFLKSYSPGYSEYKIRSYELLRKENEKKKNTQIISSNMPISDEQNRSEK